MNASQNADATAWLTRAAHELDGARVAWDEGNAGKGRVCARRAAGMALKAWLVGDPRPAGPDYGRSFMHHLNALADDGQVETAVREAAARLAARAVPPGGFTVPLPERLTPMHDAELIMSWCAGKTGA